MALSAVVETVRSRIAAALPAESVTYFDCTEAAEKALDAAVNGRGVAVYVYPIIGLSKQANQRAFVRVSAEIAVVLEINPDANAKTAKVDYVAAAIAILDAVLKPAADLNDTQFDVPERAVVIDDSDPGLLTYTFTFLKDAVIS